SRGRRDGRGRLFGREANRDRLDVLVYTVAGGAAVVRAGAGVRAGRAHARRSRGDDLPMPIIAKLDDVLYARRMTLTELSERVDLTLTNLSVLKTGKARAI